MATPCCGSRLARRDRYFFLAIKKLGRYHPEVLEAVPVFS